MKTKITIPLKQQLLNTLSTAREAKYMISKVVSEDKDKDINIIERICTNSSHFITKTELIALINQYEESQINRCKWDDEHIALGNDCWIYTNTINESQNYITEDIQNYTKHDCKYNPSYYVYIKMDKDYNTISFKLGNKEKTLNLIYNTEFVSKPVKNELWCSDFERLKKDIEDDFWNPRMIDLGRKVLKIKDVI